MKVKVKELTQADLEKIKKAQVNKAKLYYQSRPFANKVYMAMQMNMPYKFISDNWEQITEGK